MSPPHLPTMKGLLQGSNQHSKPPTRYTRFHAFHQQGKSFIRSTTSEVISITAGINSHINSTRVNGTDLNNSCRRSPSSFYGNLAHLLFYVLLPRLSFTWNWKVSSSSLLMLLMFAPPCKEDNTNYSHVVSCCIVLYCSKVSLHKNLWLTQVPQAIQPTLFTH